MDSISRMSNLQYEDVSHFIITKLLLLSHRHNFKKCPTYLCIPVYIYYCVGFFLMSLPTSSSSAQTQFCDDVTDFYVAFRLGSRKVLQIHTGKSHDLPFSFYRLKFPVNSFLDVSFIMMLFGKMVLGLNFWLQYHDWPLGKIGSKAEQH